MQHARRATAGSPILSLERADKAVVSIEAAAAAGNVFFACLNGMVQAAQEIVAVPFVPLVTEDLVTVFNSYSSIASGGDNAAGDSTKNATASKKKRNRDGQQAEGKTCASKKLVHNSERSCPSGVYQLQSLYGNFVVV